MKTFLTDIFPRIQRFSENLDNITLLTNKHWVSIDNISSSKTVFIFRTNNELLVSTNGIVARERWEYLGNKSFLINMNSQCYLLKHSFFDGNIMALKIDSKEEYAVFVNENRYDGELNSIDRVFDFLRRNYIHSTIGKSTGPVLREETVYRETQEGDTLKIVSINNTTLGAKVYINGTVAKDGIYIYESFTHKLKIKNGVIAERFYLEKVKDIIFEKINSFEPTIGDKVYLLNWISVPNGKYKYSLFKSYEVVNGKIIR
jgi:hypothetical protein